MLGIFDMMKYLMIIALVKIKKKTFVLIKKKKVSLFYLRIMTFKMINYQLCINNEVTFKCSYSFFLCPRTNILSFINVFQ